MVSAPNFEKRVSGSVIRRSAAPPKVDVDAQYEVLKRKVENQKFSFEPTTSPASFMSQTITMEVEAIDKEKALAYLEANSDNREMRTRTALRYAKAMLSGKWELTHQGIAFDHMDVLIDGQHRLWAIVLAAETMPNISIRMMVSRGYSPETFRAVDCGAGRHESDLMKDSTGRRMARDVAATAKAMVLGHRISGGNYARENSGALEKDDLADFINTYRSGIDWAIENVSGKQIANATIRSVFARAATVRPETRPMLAEFVRGVQGDVSVPLGTNHPAVLFRKLLTGNTKAPKHVVYRKLETALTSYLEGKTMEMLRESKTEKFPLPGWARDQED